MTIKGKTASNIAKYVIAGIILTINIVHFIWKGEILSQENQISLGLMGLAIFIPFTPIDLSLILEKFAKKKAGIE